MLDRNTVQVSIIVVNYNTFETTVNCLQSILDFVKGVSFEIVLVDNNSTDVNPQKFKERFPDIKLVISPTNVGFAKGNNLGLSKSGGEYILLLNSDTLLTDDAVTIVHEFLKSQEKVAVATARLQYPDGRVQHNCQRFPSISARLFEVLRLQKIFQQWGGKILFGPFFNYNSIAYPDWVWGTFFFFKRNLLIQLTDNKLPDDFFMYGEDVQWCYEFKRLGYSIAFVPHATVTHLMGKSGGQAALWMKQNQQRFLDLYYSRTHQRVISFFDWLLRKTSR